MAQSLDLSFSPSVALCLSHMHKHTVSLMHIDIDMFEVMQCNQMRVCVCVRACAFVSLCLNVMFNTSSEIIGGQREMR